MTITLREIRLRHMLERIREAESHSRFERAGDLWAKLISLHPEDPLLYELRARFYVRREDKEKALENYNLSIDLGTSRADAYTARGDLFREMGHTEEALEDYAAALEVEDTSFEAQLQRVTLLQEVDKHDEARIDIIILLKQIRRFINIVGPSSYNLYRLGQVCELAGDVQGAISAYRQYLRVTDKSLLRISSAGMFFDRRTEVVRLLDKLEGVEDEL